MLDWVSVTFVSECLFISQQSLCAVWWSRTCLSYIAFTDSRIVLNQDGFSKKQIQSIERKERYIIIKIHKGKKHSYWLGMEQSMPGLIEKNLYFYVESYC